MKKVMYLDFDSTIANSEQAFCEVYNERYENYEGFVPAKGEDVIDWSFKYSCPLIHKHNEDYRSEVMDIFGSAKFFEKLEFYNNAKEIMIKLQSKYDLVICTSASPENASKKVLWIEEHLPFIEEVIILINHTKNGIGKGRVHMIEDNSIFIDDHPSNLRSTKASEKVLFKYKETNFNSDWEGDIVSSWEDIEKKFLD
ncbi:MAG: HAD hydrolase-like protein [Firmicutes bacterium]|jgi:5'(3')-deoxyribonucleotidase|nr:HAD hydrolase-like protein [Bacillota bacterium]